MDTPPNPAPPTRTDQGRVIPRPIRIAMMFVFGVIAGVTLEAINNKSFGHESRTSFIIKYLSYCVAFSSSVSLLDFLQAGLGFGILFGSILKLIFCALIVAFDFTISTLVVPKGAHPFVVFGYFLVPAPFVLRNFILLILQFLRGGAAAAAAGGGGGGAAAGP